MAIGLGEGAELRAPLAVTVIGGLSVATLLTLVIIPVVYSLMDRKPDAIVDTLDLPQLGHSVDGVAIEPITEVT